LASSFDASFTIGAFEGSSARLGRMFSRDADASDEQDCDHCAGSHLIYRPPPLEQSIDAILLQLPAPLQRLSNAELSQNWPLQSLTFPSQLLPL
jgi:hypothetical protein